MKKPLTKKQIECSHKSAHLVVVEICVTCEVVEEVCDTCKKVLRTLTDC